MGMEREVKARLAIVPAAFTYTHRPPPQCVQVDNVESNHVSARQDRTTTFP